MLSRFWFFNCIYYILLQKDGSVYLACGDFDYGEGGTQRDDSYFSLMIQCKEGDIQEEKEQNIIECCKLANLKFIRETELIEEVERRYKTGTEQFLDIYIRSHQSWLERIEEKMYEAMEE